MDITFSLDDPRDCQRVVALIQGAHPTPHSAVDRAVAAFKRRAAQMAPGARIGTADLRKIANEGGLKWGKDLIERLRAEGWLRRQQHGVYEIASPDQYDDTANGRVVERLRQGDARWTQLIDAVGDRGQHGMKTHKAVKELIAAGRVRKVKRGLYALIVQ